MLNSIGLKHLTFLKGRYNILLICLLLLFIFHPYNSNLFYLGIWKFLLTATIASAIFNCQHPKAIKIIEIILAIPAVLLTWIVLLTHSHWMFVINTGLNILFTFLCTASIIYDVLVKKKVTFEVLKGVICAYFLIGLGFAYFFWIIEFLDPGSFLLTHQTISIHSYAAYLGQMLYFSFGNFLTIGFGDIVPIKEVAQVIVSIEMIVGRLYMVMLVARFVVIYAIPSHEERLKLPKKNNA